MSDKNWTRHLDRVLDLHRVSISPLTWGGVESGSDVSLALSLQAARFVADVFESSEAVEVVNLGVNHETSYDDEGGYYDNYYMKGEIAFRIDEQRLEAVEVDAYIGSNFESFLEELAESGVDASHPVFSERLKALIDDFSSDIDNNETIFMEKDFNDSVMNDESFEVTRQEFLSCRVGSVADSQLLVDLLRKKGKFISHFAVPNAMNGEGLDFSQPRPVWNAETVANISLHLSGGMPADACDGRGITPLLAAAHFGSIEAMEALLDAGASVDAVSPAGVDLLGAAILGREPVKSVAYLAERVGVSDGPVHARNLLLATTLGALTDEVFVPVVNSLHAAGADFNVRLPSGKTFMEGVEDFVHERHATAALQHLGSLRMRDVLDGVFSQEDAPLPKRSPSMSF